ncbi:N-acetylmuramoyl-L-alanine amidase family protein [Paenibacillus sp. KQZ6P-2]|uniref:N-acetylmuramoyl-L-alanine amidase family protein n=1 Tax=Paenibacillus mangrovi TaxID=2931978 RepID=A0A9X1WS72_9BACL|nr:N-acetylmuramoyl-L-alanine amidase family protein [Paenibacillus mangrovi]MCJ8014307.1 N-acetylmuramoyl-L-alanine amidase family protein [Paenibacillus mangrovi]
MKKTGFLLFLLMMIVMMVSVQDRAAAAATGNVHILLDGNELQVPKDAKITNVNGSVMVPFRVIGENLGFDVKWDQKSKKVLIHNDSKDIELVVNQKSAKVNGKKVTLDNPPLLQKNTVVVPVRFVSEQMGIQVSWDGPNQTVYLTSNADASKPDSGSGAGNGDMPIPDPLPGNSTSGEPGEGSDPSATVPPVAGNAVVSGISFSENRLMIATQGGAVTPKVFKMTGPDRIVVDLPNANFSPDFLGGAPTGAGNQGQLDVSGYPDVYSIRYSLFSNSPSTVRVVIDLNNAKDYSVYNDVTNSGLLIVDLNKADSTPANPTGGNGKKVVVIDAGHGNQDPGTIGYSKTKEKDFNLGVALKVGELLANEPNIDCVLTRSDDTFLELKDRARIANDLNADVFISIHANSANSTAASGSETYYQRDASKALANVMHNYLVKATGLSDRGVRYGNYHVIRETKMPAVLLEVGYLSNPKDEAALFSESLQNSVAQGIVNGIKEYLGIQ